MSKLQNWPNMNTDIVKQVISALDGNLKELDRFRTKIWEELDDENGFGYESVIHDNNPGLDDDGEPATKLGDGQILIHKN